MFVSKEIAGMGESPSSTQKSSTQTKSGEVLLAELQNVKITSHTGLTERRKLIRSWSTEALIRAHTELRTRLTLIGSVTYADRVLLEAMEKEGIELGGYHTGKIQTLKEHKLNHGQGLTTTGSNGDTVAGFTKIAVWQTIS